MTKSVHKITKDYNPKTTKEKVEENKLEQDWTEYTRMWGENYYTIKQN